MNVLALFKNVTTFVFDVDGVLTDGSLLVLPNGIWARKMNIKDGYALQLAIKKGYRIAIISGSYSEEVKDRLNKLGVQDVFMKIKDKKQFLQQYTQQHNLQKQEVLFMGDDMPDFEVMQSIGLPCCPSDAVPEIKSISLYISQIAGGEGCVRDVIEKTLKLNGHWTIGSDVTAQ